MDEQKNEVDGRSAHGRSAMFRYNSDYSDSTLTTQNLSSYNSWRTHRFCQLNRDHRSWGSH